MWATLKRYLWPAADVGERLSSVLTGATAAIALVLAILDWMDWFDLNSNLTLSLLVFAAGVVLLHFLIESERRRDQGREFASLKASLDAARTTFVEAHDPQSARQIPGITVNSVLEETLESSNFWLYRGGSARYQRGRVLPRLSRITAADVPYQVQILDPRDIELCELYAEYRRQARPADQQLDVEDAASIRNEIFATLYAVGWYRHQSRVRPRVVLMNSFSPIRIDVGASGAVFTVASHSAPALYAPAASFLYAAIKDEIEQIMNVMPRVDVPINPAAYPASVQAVSPTLVEAALSQMSVVSVPGAAPEPLLPSKPEVDFAAIANRVFVASPY